MKSSLLIVQGTAALLAKREADWTVLWTNIVTVIGPTPPGTGVM
jgi:hypothetical protein